MNNRNTATGDPFDVRLAQAEQRLSSPKKNRKKPVLTGDSSLNIALRIASDLIAGIAVGLAIGYELDRWTGHKPLFIIVFTILGMGAGMRNVWRVVNVINVPADVAGTQKNGRDQRGQRIDD